jgi:hypothetical protein
LTTSCLLNGILLSFLHDCGGTIMTSPLDDLWLLDGLLVDHSAGSTVTCVQIISFLVTTFYKLSTRSR